MWPGPYGNFGSRKYLLASCDQSLTRLGLFDPDTPLAETMGALADIVRQGKALYVGISSYPRQQTIEAHKILKEMGVPLVIHQPSYSILNRWIEMTERWMPARRLALASSPTELSATDC
jgi:L-glyceraldehyde 3-phosphate reductase